MSTVVALTQDNYNVQLASLLADGLPQSHSGDFIPIAVTDEFEVFGLSIHYSTK